MRKPLNQPHEPTTRLVGDIRMKGVELGGALGRSPDGNSFFLDACINVAPEPSEKFYYDGNRAQRGYIHLYGHAAYIPLYDNTVDYVVSSHVMEHVPDLLRAWREWERVVRPGGYFLWIVPNPDALKSDERPLELFTINRIWRAYEERWHWDHLPAPEFQPVGGPYGHWWKFTPGLLRAAVARWRPRWALVDEEVPDSKVGNGFFQAYQLT